MFVRTIIASACLVTSYGVLAENNYKNDFKNERMPLIPVTIPVLNGGFAVTLNGLYLKPTSSNLQYTSFFIAQPQTDDFISLLNSNSSSVNPKYTWGFMLGLGYIFPNTANDTRLTWTRLHDNGNSNSTFIEGSDSANVIVFPHFETDTGTTLSGGDFMTIKGKASYHFDAIDFTFGQYINIGKRLETRLFAGLRWAQLKNDLSADYSGVAPVISADSDNFTATEESNSTFQGIGPLMGIEGNYLLGYHIGIAGYLDGALLVGKLKLHQSTYLTDFATDTVIENSNFNYDALSEIAIAWDARLGINYTYFITNHGSFKLEIGYQVSQYLDTIRTADFNFASAMNNGSTVNFGLNGLYLSGTLNI